MEYLIVVYEGDPVINQKLMVSRRELFKFIQENSANTDISFVVYELECVIDLS